MSHNKRWRVSIKTWHFPILSTRLIQEICEYLSLPEIARLCSTCKLLVKALDDWTAPGRDLPWYYRGHIDYFTWINAMNRAPSILPRGIARLLFSYELTYGNYLRHCSPEQAIAIVTHAMVVARHHQSPDILFRKLPQKLADEIDDYVNASHHLLNLLLGCNPMECDNNDHLGHPSRCETSSHIDRKIVPAAIEQMLSDEPGVLRLEFFYAVFTGAPSLAPQVVPWLLNAARVLDQSDMTWWCPMSVDYRLRADMSINVRLQIRHADEFWSLDKALEHLCELGLSNSVSVFLELFLGHNTSRQFDNHLMAVIYGEVHRGAIPSDVAVPQSKRALAKIHLDAFPIHRQQPV